MISPNHPVLLRFTCSCRILMSEIFWIINMVNKNNFFHKWLISISKQFAPLLNINFKKIGFEEKI